VQSTITAETKDKKQSVTAKTEYLLYKGIQQKYVNVLKKEFDEYEGNADIDEVVTRFSHCVYNAAKAAIPVERNPKKPWINREDITAI